jgi:hypothetical protein
MVYTQLIGNMVVRAAQLVDLNLTRLNLILVPARGLEPRTLGLKDRCSTRLSYAGT